MKMELCNKDSDCDGSDDFHNGPNLNAFVENCPKKIITPKLTADDKNKKF